MAELPVWTWEPVDDGCAQCAGHVVGGRWLRATMTPVLASGGPIRGGVAPSTLGSGRLGILGIVGMWGFRRISGILSILGILGNREFVRIQEFLRIYPILNYMRNHKIHKFGES